VDTGFAIGWVGIGTRVRMVFTDVAPRLALPHGPSMRVPPAARRGDTGGSRGAGRFANATALPLTAVELDPEYGLANTLPRGMYCVVSRLRSLFFIGSKDHLLGRFSARTASYAVLRRHRRTTVSKSFKIHDRVSWNSEAGHVSGTVIRVHTCDFDHKGYTHHASPDAPQYEIKSAKTDHIAFHLP
jgi:hypothetical protein